ncbi:MAG: LysM peptidoglycan-binding domain-containing protein [Myxococcota bacterium]
MRTRPFSAIALLAWVSTASAQAPGPSPTPAPPPPAPAAPAESGQPSGATGAGAASSTTTTTTYVPFGVPSPGTDINAGLPSSSRPITGDKSDGFDLGTAPGGAGVVYGGKGASGVLPGDRVVIAPDVHTVQKGDTLWDLCDTYFHNPWEWPSIWSYNPQIQNPHWIYPGDQLRLRNPNQLSDGRPETLGTDRGGLLNRRPRVPRSTVFLRDQGFIGDPSKDVWGELVGAVEEQMMLSEGNHVYLTLRPGVNLQVGQELTVFREVRQPENVSGARKPKGQIVAVNGTVKIDRWDPKTRIARGVISESVDVIERGAKVGPVGRKFDVIPPKPSARKVEARVLTSFYPHVYLAQNQVVFLDHGGDDGLEPGNTLFVLRRGDTWRASLATNSKMARDRVRMDSPERVDVETTPLRGEPEKFPEEAVAELRVLRTEKQSAIALVTQSRREVVPGDRAVSVVGR